MVERVFPTESNTATFICPQCKKSKTVDVSKFANTSRTVKISSTCSCGHKWVSTLDKRRVYRKTVNLPGTYDHIKDGKVVDRGGMNVVDLSFSGVKMKLNVERNLQAGEHLNLEFHLDDSKHTLIKKGVTIRNVSGVYIGATFATAEAYDPVLGFYLMVDNRSGDDRRVNTDRRTGGASSQSQPEKRAIKYRRSDSDRRTED